MWPLAASLICLISCTVAYYEGSKHVSSFGATDLYNLRNDQSDILWLVQFYNGSDKEMVNISKAFETTAKSMEGYVRTGAVDIEKTPLTNIIMQLTEFPVYAYYGYYKYMPDIFTKFRTIHKIHEEAAKQMTYLFEERSIPRFVIDKSNYELGTTDIDYRLMNSEDAWGVLFYDISCSKCLKLAEDWKVLVTNFKEVMQFGAVNNPIYNVLPAEGLEYPIIQYYPDGPKEGVIPENYTGAMDYLSLYEYFNGKLKEPQIIRVTDLETVLPCLKKHYCVFTFLPSLDVCDPACRKKNLDNLSSAAKTFKLQSIFWLWNEFDEQPDLQNVFGLEKCTHPVIVFLNLHTATFAKIDTDAIKLDVITKIMEHRANDETFPYQIPIVPPPNINSLNVEHVSNAVKDEL